MNKKPDNHLSIIAIAGPTATGKTDVALALALLINAEIVSCDSMQVYKGLATGTAKPSLSQMKKIPHKLIGRQEHGAVFNAVEFMNLAVKAIRTIRKNGKNVVVAGGTGFYLQVLFEGIFQGVSRNKSIRQIFQKRAAEEGLERLYHDLKEKDEVYANMISSSDERRIIRALEVIQETGEKFSEIRKKRKPLIREPYRIMCLTMDRDILYRRINDRVDRMMREGLLEEAREIYHENLPEDATLRQAIGYKEFFDFIEGKATLSESIERVKRNTRRFAKRQVTWFKKMKNVTWIDASRPVDKIVQEIINVVGTGRDLSV